MTGKQEPLVITLSGEMPQKRQMVFQVGLDCSADLATVNAMLDKMRVAFERQAAFGELEIFKLELEQQEKQAEDHAARLQIVDENVVRDWGNRRGEIKLSHKQEQEQKQAHENAKAIKNRIAKVKNWIAQAEAKIAG